MDIHEVAFSKLQIGQSNLKEEPLEVTTSLIPPAPTTEASGDAMENTDREELSEAEKRLQMERRTVQSCMTGYTWANLAINRRETQTPMTTQHTLTLDKDMNIQ